jgi:ribokinase
VRNVVHYHGDGSRTWDLVHGEQHFEDMSVHPGDLGADLLAADGILISAMGRAAQLELTPWLREHSSATIFLDLQEDYLAGHEQDWLALIPSCDVFLPSEVEAVALSGGTDLERAIRGFAALGPHTVVIKRAGRSCLLLQSADDGQEPDLVEVAVTAVTPVDSTGAGDAFCGAFAAQFLLSGDGAEAVRAGAEAARTAISAPGILGLLAATGVRE